MRIISHSEIARLFPKRRADSNKGDYGRVLIIAGSKGMAGAAVLSARAALKAGAGLVTIAIPESSQPVAAICVPEALTLPLPETRTGTVSPAALKTIAEWKKKRGFDVFLIGPGLGATPETAQFVCGMISAPHCPFVMDADALNCAAQHGDLRKLFAKAAQHVLTPHPGEISRLLKIPVPVAKAERISAIKKLCALTGGAVILKGSASLVSDGKTIAENPTGGPALAKAGSGDVLAGLLAGYWAQFGKARGFGMATAYEAAKAAAYIHGLSGDHAAKALGERSVLAGELLSHLPHF
ncbi:MAG: NAD(P)H-hydrate dehydratase [Elusimicrobiales bacterium]|nr:NAD(P)H-hydrate dehydratase [Elusimicrobiales bacterium]